MTRQQFCFTCYNYPKNRPTVLDSPLDNPTCTGVAPRIGFLTYSSNKPASHYKGYRPYPSRMPGLHTFSNPISMPFVFWSVERLDNPVKKVSCARWWDRYPRLQIPGDFPSGKRPERSEGLGQTCAAGRQVSWALALALLRKAASMARAAGKYRIYLDS